MKQVKVRNLPAPGREDPPHYLDKPRGFEIRHGPPKRGWATARFETYLGDCRVHLTVVCAEAEQAKHRLPLTESQVEDIEKAVSDLVITLKKHAFGEGAPRP